MGEVERLEDLGFLFRVVAGLELAYAAVGILTPPGLMTDVTGWVLSDDGQWLAKLLGVSLGAQAWIAWSLRDQPHLGVAKGLAFYQFASATADWVMWIALDDAFSTTRGRILVVCAIATHYALGLLMVRAIRNKSTSAAPRRALAPFPARSR
jgi:hypothetical protein